MVPALATPPPPNNVKHNTAHQMLSATVRDSRAISMVRARIPGGNLPAASGVHSRRCGGGGHMHWDEPRSHVIHAHMRAKRTRLRLRDPSPARLRLGQSKQGVQHLQQRRSGLGMDHGAQQLVVPAPGKQEASRVRRTQRQGAKQAKQHETSGQQGGVQGGCHIRGAVVVRVGCWWVRCLEGPCPGDTVDSHRGGPVHDGLIEVSTHHTRSRQHAS
jgi:hypothetical protein